MKTKEVIRQLMEADPTGEEEVCVGNVDIHFIDPEPAYYDGSLQVLERDPTNKYYNIVGAKYRRTGKKIVIHTLSIHDAISNNHDMPVDYSELNPDQAEATRKAHDALREWHRKLDIELEQENFVVWAKAQAEKLTADTEDIVDQAKAFYEKNLSPQDPLPEGGVPLGQSYNSTRHMQWDEKCEVVVDEGFLKIRKK